MHQWFKNNTTRPRRGLGRARKNKKLLDETLGNYFF
jgi:hypothetical protein